MLKKVKDILYRSLENKDISYKKMQNIMQKNTNAILLDVRSKQEYEEGHLEGSINIPLYEIDKNLEKLPDKKCIFLIYCTSGHRSKQAKKIGKFRI